MSTISAVIITRNEERNIERCLESIKWVDEIILVDMFSTDRTVEITRKYTDKIYFNEHYLNDMRKNFGFEKATGDWIINIDADEVVSTDLCNEIIDVTQNNPQHDGYFIPFKHYFMNRWIKHGGWYPCYLIRLFRNGEGHFAKEDEHQLLQVRGTTGYLNNPFIHIGLGDAHSFAKKHDLYSTNIAMAAFRRGEKVSLGKLFFRPLYIFIKRFIIQLGFLDGIPGLILMSEYVYFLFLEQVKLLRLHYLQWRRNESSL